MLVPRSTCIQQKHMRCRPSLRRSPQRECEYIAEFYVINREKLTCWELSGNTKSSSHLSKDSFDMLRQHIDPHQRRDMLQFEECLFIRSVYGAFSVISEVFGDPFGWSWLPHYLDGVFICPNVLWFEGFSMVFHHFKGNFQNLPDEFDENKRTKAPLVVLASPCGGLATVFDSPMKLAGFYMKNEPTNHQIQ